MNTLIDINKLISWEYISCDMNHVRIASPFTLADDGEQLCFSIIYPNSNSFKLIDDYQVAMHAAMKGILLNKGKIDLLNRTVGISQAKFEEDGQISASGNLSSLQDAILDATKLAMAFSFNYHKWMPKFNNTQFRLLVEKALRATIDDNKIMKECSITGASGHVIKFPYAIQLHDSKILIETVATTDKQSIDWNNVYRSHGRLSDVKKIDDRNKRLVIIEQSPNKSEFERASSFLADVASIRTLESTNNWAKELKVA